jgi:hypothetical protein
MLEYLFIFFAFMCLYRSATNNNLRQSPRRSNEKPLVCAMICIILRPRGHGFVLYNYECFVIYWWVLKVGFFMSPLLGKRPGGECSVDFCL